MKKRIISIAILAILLGISFYALRGPNISNALKKVILPELELMTGRKFITQKIYINIFPLFVEMKDVKAFDDNGNRIFSAERVKGYVGISGLLRKEIVLRRLVIKGPVIQSDRGQVEEIAQNVKKYLAEESKMPFKVIIKSVDIGNGVLSLQDKDYKLLAEGMNAEITISRTPRFRISAHGISVMKEGFPEFTSMLEMFFFLKEGEVDLKSLRILSHGSEIKTSGTFGTEKLSGEFGTEINLLTESIKRVFGLKNRGDGKVVAHGSLRIDGLKTGQKIWTNKVFMDLKIKGDLFLETLMELLSVKETLKGYLNFEGKLNGYLNDLQGNAKARLENGNLFDVEIDSLNCNVSYKDGTMKFTDGSARLYKGTAHVEATIQLPVVNYYTLKVGVKDVSSKGLFKLIRWDPHIPEGRVSGEIESAGSEFNPHGNFYYSNLYYIGVPKDRDILDRVKKIESEFSMKGDEIYFPEMFISTDKSSILTSGTVDLKKNTLSFAGNGATDDVKEFSSPYFTALSGPGKFNCSVSGTFKDPVIDLKFASNNTIFSIGELGIPDVLKKRVINFDRADAEMIYRKNLLTVKNITASTAKEEYRASGSVYFKKALELFELREPDYDLNISARNIDIKALSDTFQDAPTFAGNMDADFRLYGKPYDIRASGDVHAKRLSLQALQNKYSVDSADGKVSYAKREFSFGSLRIKRGTSTLNANGILTLDKRFSFAARGQNVKAVDIIPNDSNGSNSLSRLKSSKILETILLTDTDIKGEGTFENPKIELKSSINGGSYKGHSVGKGMLKGILIDKHAEIAAEFLNGRMSIKGNADLTEKLPWSATVELQTARYDFIAAGFLKDIPEDLLLNLTGNIKAYGDKDHINAIATINRVHLYLYGIGFTNSSDIIARLEDRKLSIGALSMKGDTTEFKLSGNMTIGKSYDLLLEGSSSLAPLKAISKTIDVVKGNASFVFSVSGDWEKPKINGGMDVSSGTLGFKDISYRLTSIAAYIYIDEDRIAIERANGKLSGGDVSISGTAFLDRFSIKRFFLESRLHNITASVSKDFWVSFDGNIYYRGTMDIQTLMGDIAIKKAKYSERIEWKSWLLKARPKERPRVEVTKLDKTNLNIRVSGTNLFIDNNVARALMKMDILLRGSIGQPILLGKVEAKEGIVYFRNNEFKVLKASVDFANPNQVNPYFDIAAETRVRNYNIRLNLDGYIEQFNLSLSSSPALDETDIFSLLTVGQMGKHLKGLEGGIGAGEATSFITGKLQDVFEERLKTITGFDRVQIDPYISKSTGTVTPRVTIAKRLLGDKLYVTYSTAVGTGEEQVLKLEYTLGKNTSLIGLRDERGGIGGDIKFRFEFK
ncbi:MAG: translocation/assembly module TamB domain-containing protein [Nitrospirota bacterium]